MSHSLQATCVAVLGFLHAFCTASVMLEWSRSAFRVVDGFIFFLEYMLDNIEVWSTVCSVDRRQRMQSRNTHCTQSKRRISTLSFHVSLHARFRQVTHRLHIQLL